MKKIIFKSIFILLSFFFIHLSFGQAPQLLNYQAVARNASGMPIINSKVSLQFTIHNITPAGFPLYQEIHDSVPTNSFGLLTVKIGGGTSSNSFGSISWESGAKHLQVEIDINNGHNFSDMGTTQLISVPYALYADTAKYAKSAPVQIQTLSLSNDTVKLSNGGGSVKLPSAIVPTMHKFLTDSGTYTLPSNPRPLYIKVTMVGGGGGGGSGTGGQTSGGNGGTSIFGTSLLTAGGGLGGIFSNLGTGGAGGTASLGSVPFGLALSGGAGGDAEGHTTTYFVEFLGGSAAVSPFGGAGKLRSASAGGSAVSNSGSGGAGGSLPSGSIANAGGGGGGAGGYVNATIVSLLSSYSYTVGNGGAAGIAGTNGVAGGVGGSGVIIVEEYYQ